MALHNIRVQPVAITEHRVQPAAPNGWEARLKVPIYQERLSKHRIQSDLLVAQVVKVSTCNGGRLGPIPGWGRSPGEGNENPLHYSCLENPMDRGTWRTIVHGVAKSWMRLSNWTTTTSITLPGNTAGSLTQPDVIQQNEKTTYRKGENIWKPFI